MKTNDGVDKNPNQKEFFMTKEEQAFLSPRMMEITKNNMVNEALKAVCDSYVRLGILGRLGIVGEEANKWDVNYDPFRGTVHLIPAGQQATSSGVIIPSMVPPKDLV